MASSFDYLKNEFPVLAKLGTLAESYCETDPNGALYKIRKIEETITTLIYQYDNIICPTGRKVCWEKGGFKRINKDFKFQLHALIAELNKYLYDDAA